MAVSVTACPAIEGFGVTDSFVVVAERKNSASLEELADVLAPPSVITVALFVAVPATPVPTLALSVIGG
jgi:hypothetical protein